MGVIYSSKGFNDTAIEKAGVNAIACCRLYRNEPSELPDSLALVSSFTRSVLSAHHLMSSGF